MVKITIYVEGGGDTKRLKSHCRKGFSGFFNKLDIKVEVVACGSRQNAYKDFCTRLKKLKSNEYCLLLVDSEAPVKANRSVWQHVYWREEDKWPKPDKATEEHLHFMVECMEAWFMADKQTLANYYGKNFNQNALSNNDNIENISKKTLEDTLKTATRDTTKGKYDKGKHSFDILSKIDADKVIGCNPYAKRLFDTLTSLAVPTL